MKTPTFAKPESAQTSIVVDRLHKVLADTYVLYLKTQNFHWNIVADDFYSLHKMLNEHYEELQEMVDEIAERLRMLKERAPGSMHEFLKLTRLEEATKPMAAHDMLAQLAQDHTQVADSIKPYIKEATEANDEGSADLLIQHLRFHEKTAWMLRSHITSDSR